MPVFRLTPKNDGDKAPLWKGSTIIPQCLWVLAQDESSARDMVAKATARSNNRKRRSPWRDPQLVLCDFDETKSLASGIICVRHGHMPYAAPMSPNMESCC